MAAIVATTGKATDVTNISIYESLWVNPVTASKVNTAPLCGNVSRPPDERDAIL